LGQDGLGAPSIAARKRKLRSYGRNLSSPPEPAAAARALDHILSLEELEHARTVASYSAVGYEVPTDGLRHALEDRGVRVALPRVAEGALVLHQIAPGQTPSPGYRGIPEPDADHPRVSPEEIDLFVVPGVLFDRLGNRLGRGGGHYDRLLAAARPDANRVGLCYADHVVDSVPVEPWDAPVDVVVTDREVIRVAPPRQTEEPL
jgi:5-formyltetrahydrofolate cyclo-ligase